MSKNGLLIKLEEISFRYDEVSKLIVDPEIISDMNRYVKLNREYKDLEPLIKVYNKYRNILSNIDSSKDIIKNESDEARFRQPRESDEADMPWAGGTDHCGIGV